MAFVPTPSPTVVDQTTLMKKYLQFVAALTDNNTADETKLKMMQEVSENFENVTSSPQYSTFLEHIIPRFLTFLQDGEVQFLQEKPAQNLPLNDLSLAVQLFAKNIDDESLPSSIQTMSCKLLLNLVDCIRSKRLR
ncbi:UNVERIFIED_CONTAM: hypothetical protein FKN15_024923 [Acipenser sinensis]